MVLDTILANPDLTNRMITMFNDKDAANVESIKTEINLLNGIERLKYAPKFVSMEVGDEIANMFRSSNLPPTFFFVDPWGYKGLSLNLVSSIIKDWGCDCVFFFNYNRVSMGIGNEAIKHHMASLFGDERLGFVRSECDKARNPAEREGIVVNELCNALKQNGSKYVLPFRFKNNEGTRTSHHLIFLSKNFRGYEIMKEIMYKESTDKSDEVASFEYNPRDLSGGKQLSLLDFLSRPLDDLQGMLLQEYTGRTIDFMTLYEAHSVDKPYIKKNYKDVLRSMFDTKMITAISTKTGKPPTRGFADEMRITFGGAK
jgi:three-Cys-motif partner protein